jgi:ketosteroid isomerase-like protein
MGAALHVDVVQRLFDEVLNQDRADIATELIHERYTPTESVLREPDTTGPDLFRREMEVYRALYADMHFALERVITDGDTIIAIWNAAGTSQHETFVTRAGREAPRRLQARVVSLSEIADGKIIRHQLFWQRDPLFP